MQGPRSRAPLSQARALAAQLQEKETAAASSSRPRPRAKAKSRAPSQDKKRVAVSARKNAKEQSSDDESSSKSSSSENDNSADEDFDGDGRKSKKSADHSQFGSQKGGNGKRKKKTESLTLPSKFSEDVLSMNELDIVASQQRAEDYIRKMDDRCQTPDSPRRFDNDSVPKLASELENCPFCNRSMPSPASERLLAMMQYWLDRLHQGKEKAQASTATLELCFRHVEESEIIPAGVNSGWIRHLDVDDLKSRIQREHDFLNRMRKRINDPLGSDWFSTFKEMRALHGRKMDSITAQMNGMADLQAGYYGELGWEAMREVLVEEFIQAEPGSKYDLGALASHPEGPFRPLSAHDFIDKILMPELVCMVIQDDEKKRVRRKKKVSILDAKQIRDASHKYGVAMFPSLGSVSLLGDESNTTHAYQKEDDASQQLTAPLSSQLLARRQQRESEGKRAVNEVDYDESSDEEDDGEEPDSSCRRSKAKKRRMKDDWRSRTSPQKEPAKHAAVVDTVAPSPSASQRARPKPRPSHTREPSSSQSRNSESTSTITAWKTGDIKDEQELATFTSNDGALWSPSLQLSSSQMSLPSQPKAPVVDNGHPRADPSEGSTESSQHAAHPRADGEWYTFEQRKSRRSRVSN